MDITILTGPTASGKTAHAIGMAQAMNGVILNADAMQMYDPLPILTAQPDAHERDAAPHRLYGVVKADEDISAADWTKIALKEIERSTQDGSHPIFVGGTGFYITSLVKGLSPIPDVPDSIRKALNAQCTAEGIGALYDRLGKEDPVMAQRLKPADTHRIIRALEIWEGTGKSLSYWQELPLVAPPADYRFHIIVMRPDIEQLNVKINARIDVMLDQGALDEIEALTHRIDEDEVPENSLIIKAHGFRPFRDFLKKRISLEDAKAHTATETRQYAKRQRTWGRTQYAADKLPENVCVEYMDV